MMTRVSHRGRGVATALMRAAERMAIERGRTCWCSTPPIEDGAAGLYERLGFKLTGVIPDYALKPHGGLTGTMIYWKRIAGEREDWTSEVAFHFKTSTIHSTPDQNPIEVAISRRLSKADLG